MKHINKICALFFILISISAAGYAQQQPMSDTLGLPGDNLNLYGVLYLFKESSSVQDFEQKLNTPDNKVNNLDLNHDGQIDYIQVIDYGKNGLHSLVLRDAISGGESQDLAVVEVEQRGDGTAHIQVVGDETLYGKNYIVEPQDQQQQTVQQPPPPQGGYYNNYNPNPPVLINVWGWPCIQFMYAPSYVYWQSPWHWGYYPGWWNPWRPFGFHAYWYSMYGYRGYQRRVYYNHMAACHSLYYGYRMNSPMVHTYIRNNTYYGPRVVANGGREMRPGNMPNNSVNNQPRNFNGGRQENFNQPRQQPHYNNNGGGRMREGGGNRGGGGGGRRR